MSNKPTADGGVDTTSHQLILEKIAPASLIALRQELAFHPDITDEAQKGATFEDCLGIIAMKLDIALDGMYDCAPLCGILVDALRAKRFGGPRLVPGLVDAELVETQGELSLQRVDPNVTTIIPDEAIVTESNINKLQGTNDTSVGSDGTEETTSDTN